MGDSLQCPECGQETETADDLDRDRAVPEVEMDDDRSIHLFENRDLFLCKNCKNPLGVSRSRRTK